MVTTLGYGEWTSPISAVDASAVNAAPHWVRAHDGHTYWTEGLPVEGGRVAVFRAAPGGAPEQVLPAPWSARNRLHEYGGAPYAVLNDKIVFTHWGDQRVYAVPVSGGEPVPLTPEPAREHGLRYGELLPAPGAGEVWCVRETVLGDAPTDLERHLVAIPLDGSAARDPGRVRVIAASHRFMTAPKASPDGRHVAWLGWEHPAMPWDGNQLCVAELADGVAGAHRVVAGGPAESVCQFEWADESELYAMTDPDGWWNLHRVGLDGTARALHRAEEDYGGPLWVIGGTWFVPLGGGKHLLRGRQGLSVLDETSGELTALDLPLPVWRTTFARVGDLVAGVAAGARTHPVVAHVDPATGRLTELTGQPEGLPDPAYLPDVVERVFTGPDGVGVPAYVYLPHNPDFTAPEGELPPFLVHVHGGPTGEVSPTLSTDFAFYTSRGIGVVAVNYGGSSGYGRAFRDRLRGQWGVVDVRDCATVAAALAAEGLADGDRLGIRGGSAGGWTTAASLTSVATYRSGVAHFPVLDLLAFAGGGTHDFESRYLDGLVGALPEHEQRYRDRSPVNRADRLAGPILLLQGLEDQVCPPEQCERFLAALAGRGTPHAYVTFEGEQHGFRRAENIQRALEAELAFFGQTLGFQPVGVAPVELRT
ncbi:dipeptidyl aminopeptidase/acylaminoacyl peptidase [Crossiella equi]|uniref:Dipeptidyl aminopeptidase/acylaminoacyl peptidase n=1 Tax=Crossiella equi TaxID=130796 RepID=A0ABS5A4G4_9PSEU|nr:prolyl oligopeptidase family serine peptidase [Crossiella equi]MBP2471433.1 dipeptidyl aminopeptidase/acylaminoacyl peptidase [Crossiella equi]